ncbi:hypothetical protein [Alienimonas chondri]|uniref:DUF4232 domain-containing protein n=1 Tax=Alienimonas chondri TaxID=2681879 RepID=A0ABX1V9K6_9PLAN|nr:hypothetical protein [Alienimonas chondri]NNJ24577.1 hypothetical protein [Alienimonas chondri]
MSRRHLDLALLLTCATFGGVCAGAPAFAQSGSESRAESDDLECVIDDRWVGGQRGGYWPVRIALTNRGAACAVTAAYLPYQPRRGGGVMPTVTRTVALPAGADTRFTLPVPLTARRGDGEIVIVADPLPEDGVVAADPRSDDDLLDAAIRELSHEVHPPGADNNAIRTPAVLILEATPFDQDAFAHAAAVTVSEVEADSSRDANRRTSAGNRGDVLVLSPEALPETWLGFTTVDLIVVDGSRLSELSEGIVQSLRTWTAAGGTLVVADAMRSDADPVPDGIESLLGAKAGSENWAAIAKDGGGNRTGQYDPEETRRIVRGLMDRFGGRRSPGFDAEGADSRMLLRPSPPAGLAPRRQAVGGGRVYLLAADGGGADDWYAVLQDLGPDRLLVADRFGVGARGPNEEFLEFLIPGVRGVPVGTLVALITLFVVAIGPVNYLILRRRHQVGRLALTVPLIAAATAGTLLAYSTVMHGFGTKVRQFAVTSHDDAANQAVEWTRTAVFAPHTPGAGLTFSPETAVFPLAPPGPNIGGGRIDWTSGQTWSGDAFRGRTRTQFVTVSPRPERGRLTVEWANGRPTVVNGYDSDFAMLVLSDDAGRVYHGVDLPAGGSGTLRLIDGDDQFAWRERLDLLLPQPLPGMEEGQDDLLNEFPMLHSDPETNASFKASLAYRTASSIRGLNEHTEAIDGFEEAPLISEPRGAFVALLEEPALTEFGGEPVDARGGAHLLIGRTQSASETRSAETRSEEPRGSISVRRPGAE